MKLKVFQCDLDTPAEKGIGKKQQYEIDQAFSRHFPKLLYVPNKAVAEKAFQLFDSEHALVELICENGMMNTVLDHFGTKVKTTQIDKDHFSVPVEVSVSPTFFAWVFEFGGKIRIAGPKQVIDAYKDLLEKSYRMIETN